MSTKSRSVSDPNAASKGFAWVLTAVVVIAILVVGFVVWQWRGKADEAFYDLETVDFTAKAEVVDGGVKLSGENPKADAPAVELYEDFSCHVCADLAKATDERMLQEIEDGNLVLTVRPLNFMDKTDYTSETGTGHSTSALAATRVLAKNGEFAAWWNMRALLMDKQAEIYNQWTDEDFAKAAAHYGASDKSVDEIKAGGELDAANKEGIANAKDLEQKTGNVSSPNILVDGKKVEVSGSIANWMDAVLK